jgi:hypothetical protein
MGWTTGIQFPSGAIMGLFSLRHCVQSVSGAYPVGGGGGGLFPEGKAVGT